jgi:hypothetical protein
MVTVPVRKIFNPQDFQRLSRCNKSAQAVESSVRGNVGQIEIDLELL